MPRKRRYAIPLSRVGAYGILPCGIKSHSLCKSCKEPIYWCTTRRGRRMALNARPDPDGHWGIEYGVAVWNSQKGDRYTNHFPGCTGPRIPSEHEELIRENWKALYYEVDYIEDGEHRSERFGNRGRAERFLHKVRCIPKSKPRLCKKLVKED